MRLSHYHRRAITPFLLIITLVTMYHSRNRFNFLENGKEMKYKMAIPNLTCEIDIDCHRLFLANPDQKAVAAAQQWKPTAKWTIKQLVDLTADCVLLRQKFFFPSTPASSEEEYFPLAYATIVFNDPEQFIRMLSLFYWPQNLYCVTYDTKAPATLVKIVENLGLCFRNIISPSKHASVIWGKLSVLEAALNCLRKLNEQTEHNWKYVQILSGHDLPLRTNAEMVRIFKIFNGANDVDLEYGYWSYRWDMKKTPPPANLTIFKGGFAASLHRDLVKFVLADKLSHELYEWLNGTTIPDEFYWQTLIYNNKIVKAPGSFPGECLAVYNNYLQQKQSVSRLQIWRPRVCGGKMYRHSCILGVKDLALLSKAPHLVAHRIYLNFEPATFYCLAQLIQNRTYFPSSAQELDYNYYEQLPAVRYHLASDKSKFNCLK